MLSKKEWLEAGASLLAESGPRGLRLELLCQEIGATRGSFYHHFENIGSYRREVAEHLEATGTTQYLEQAESVADEGPLAQIDLLRRAVIDYALTEREMRLERAFRAWATQEPYVAEIVQRTDAARLGYVTDLFSRAGVPNPAEQAALVYLSVIGAHYVVPPLSTTRVSELLDGVIRAATGTDVQNRDSR